MWPWLRFLFLPWLDAVQARRERDEAVAFLDEYAVVMGDNLAAVVMAAGSSVTVSREVMDFVSGSDDLIVKYLPAEGGSVVVSLAYACDEPACGEPACDDGACGACEGVSP